MGVASSELVRSDVRGPPGAQVRKYNRHVSCNNAQWWEDTSFQGRMTDAQGVLINSYPLPSPMPCDAPILGEWESYVVVGGFVSNYHLFTYYNSAGCRAPVATYEAARTYCPARGACNGPGCP